MGRSRGLMARLEALLQRHWWRPEPSALSLALQPLAWLHGWLARRSGVQLAKRATVPLLVVGNITVGGAGKTPTVMALVEAFRAAGRHPGVVSRGYGRQAQTIHAVEPGDSASLAGDEPLLIRRRTGVPVFVGRERSAAVRALCERHPEVDVILSDDGLQHHALHRDAELLVFDQRGIGNGLLLPAGPLRQPLPSALGPMQRVLYTSGVHSTTLPGDVALRSISLAWPLNDWRAGHQAAAQPLSALAGRPMLAVAGLAAPEKFFDMLERSGLQITRCALPDHHPYRAVPWPADTHDVVTTEKDAVKLTGLALGAVRVWVVPLDFALPPGLIDDLLALLPSAPHRTPTP